MTSSLARGLWWLIHKDLLREMRAPRVWPGMLLLGIVLALVIEMQIDLPRPQRATVMGGLFWLTAFFAATLALDRSFAGERDEGCWHGLLLYPISPATIFLAKLTANLTALWCLECVLIPAFVVFSDVPIPKCSGEFLAIMFLANFGYAALGTVLSALTNGLQHRGGLLVLLLLPLISPIILGATQATRLLLAGESGVVWGRWGQLLTGSAALFVLLGALLFEFVVED